MVRAKKQRRHETREKNNQQKKKLSKEALWSIFLGIIMVLSIAGAVVFDDNSGAVDEYNGFKFVIANNYYVSKIDGESKYFNYFPSQVDYIEIPPEVLVKLESTPQLYMTFKPEPEELWGMDLIRFDLSKALIEDFDKAIGMGIADIDNRYVLPLIGCDNSTTFVPVMYFELSNRTEAVLEGNCLVFRGRSQEDFAMFRDRILYSLYGVI